MPRSMKDEYSFDPSLEDGAITHEFHAVEELLPPAPEFGGRSGGAESDGSRHERLKRLLLMPIIASIATVSIVFASFGSDPLGSAFFGGTPASSSSPADTSTPGSDTTPGADTTSADTDTEKAPDYDDKFPTLPNADPDFAGDYAWSGMGTEEYLFVDGNALVAGTIYTDSGIVPGNIPGAEYDKATNTLTLTDYKGSSIDANLMGNGFTIKLVGDSSLDFVQAWGAMYGGSITFTGDGTLKINESVNSVSGLVLNCENSPSCIMIDRNVTLEVYGSKGNPAISISDSTLDETVVYLKPIEVTGDISSDHVIFAPAEK